MRNTLGDLNNHLFAELERLSDEDLTEEQIQKEIQRAEAVTKVAGAIVQNAALIVRAASVYDDLLDANTKKPAMLEG